LPGHFSLPPMFHSGKGNREDREKGWLTKETNETTLEANRVPFST
jgi:hypothetical protein